MTIRYDLAIFGNLIAGYHQSEGMIPCIHARCTMNNQSDWMIEYDMAIISDLAPPLAAATAAGDTYSAVRDGCGDWPGRRAIENKLGA